MKNEVTNNLVMIAIPLDALITSGLTSNTPVQVSAANGIILIERDNEECEECDCICDECREKLGLDESEAES